MNVGDKVRVRGFNDMLGTITTTKEDKFLVDCGVVKMWMKEYELEPQNAENYYPVFRNPGVVKIKKELQND